MPAYSFHEVMRGSLCVEGERFDRPFRFDLMIHSPQLLEGRSPQRSEAAGRVWIDGIATESAASGFLEIAPFRGRRIGYQLDFRADDGTPYRFEGEKQIRLRQLVHTWTTLPGRVTRPDGKLLGQALLHFDSRRDLADLLRSFTLQTRRAARVDG